MLFVVDADSVPKPDFFLVSFLRSSFFFLCLIFAIVFTNYYYKNTFYAYTNKRVILKSIMLGEDYKNIDFEDLSLEVKVSLLDKMLKRKTGAVKFLSKEDNSMCVFSHIKEPEMVAEEIQEKLKKQ